MSQERRFHSCAVRPGEKRTGAGLHAAERWGTPGEARQLWAQGHRAAMGIGLGHPRQCLRGELLGMRTEPPGRFCGREKHPET